MDRLRSLALTAGRAFALLAALMVALLPGLPAQAHLHAPDGLAAKIAPHRHQGPVSAVAASSEAQDHDHGGGQPPHACDCCCLSHAPVLPSAAIVPLPAPVLGAFTLRGGRTASPDALAEKPPEPPRPLA